MKIRPAVANDAPNIADIHATSWRNTYQGTLTAEYLSEIVSKDRYQLWKDRFDKPKSNQYVIVAEQDAEMVGFACVYVGENSQWGSYVDNLHVRKDQQSKGIGKALLAEICRWCLQVNPAGSLCLTVNQDNVKAQQFYRYVGAHNEKEDLWNAPDGSTVPIYWFVWDEIGSLAENG